jgi:aminopeptidase N
MENWGLVIGHYSGFLLDPQYAGAEDRALVCEQIAHELTHMVPFPLLIETLFH